jgi:hypothetical protein
MTLVGVPAGASVINGVVTWRLGTMRAGQTRTVSLRARIGGNAPLGRYTNTATVTARNIPAQRARTSLMVTGPRRIPRSGGVTG